MVTTSLNEETSKNVIRQVEFYFSDSNLPKDNFLRKTIEESEDGLVSLALLCSFSGMRALLGLGREVKPEDVSVKTVKAVAETIKTSPVIKISADGTRVGRITELLKPEEVIEQIDTRTVVASPFEHNVALEVVEAFFGQHGKVNSIRLPRHVADKRFPCGTALIEFSTEEDAASILKQNWTFAGTDLELKPKKDFDAEREKLTAELENSCPSNGQKDTSTPAIDKVYPKGLVIAFKLKHKSGGGSAENNKNHETTDSGDVVSTGVAPDKSKQEASENAKDGEVVEPVDNEEKATNGGKSQQEINRQDKDIVLREDLKDVFQRFGNVMYVDFSMGKNSGHIRFREAEAGQKACAAAVLLETGLAVKNFFLTLEPVTGEVEKEYWAKFPKRSRGRGGKSRRGGRGGKHLDKKRPSREDDSGGGRSKKARRRDNDSGGGRSKKARSKKARR